MITSFKEYESTYKKSVENPEGFWSEIADSFVWRKKWNEVLRWDFHKPEISWFAVGKLNITENAIDRHLPQRAGQIAAHAGSPRTATR